MTEIPEHLLKRSKERRSALGLPGGEGDGEPAADAPEAKAAATPAKAAAPAAPAKTVAAPPPPPKPKPAYIQAAESRKRIPYWAMGILVIFPVWAFMYASSVTEPTQTDEAIVVGEEVYGGCAGCHGGTGGGGTGAQLSDGEVLKTFPDPLAMMQWIYLGGDEWTGTTGAADYGDPEREGGPRNTGDLESAMPAFGDLTPAELAGVTRYIREDLSGAPVATPELAELYETWAEEAIETADAGELVYNGVDPDEERVTAAAGE